LSYLLYFASSFCEFFEFVDEIFVEIRNCLTTQEEFFEFVDEIFVEIRNCLTTQEEFFEFPKMNRKQNPKRAKGKEELLLLLVTKVNQKLWIASYFAMTETSGTNGFLRNDKKDEKNKKLTKNIIYLKSILLRDLHGALRVRGYGKWRFLP